MTNGKKEENGPKPEVRPQERRRRWLALSFVLFVVVPSILGIIYFAAVGSDRYVSGAGFAVRSMKPSGGIDAIGTFTGLAGTGSSAADSYIVLKYLESRDLLDRLEQDFDFRAAYSAPGIDPVSRLNPDLDIERVLKYWHRRVRTTFDPTSGIISFEVEAFSAKDSQRVAELMLGYVQTLVNQLSEKARQDAESYAEGEVARAEGRLRESLRRIREFREKEESIDPAASAAQQIELLGSMEKRLLEIKARMAALKNVVADDAPSLGELRRLANALEQQIREKSRDAGTAEAANTLSGLLAEYEELQVENSFAQKSYASALGSLETARVEAERQQRYLAVFSKPAMPEYPIYPRRVVDSILVVVVSSMLWGIGALVVYAVRDHLS